MPQKFSTPTPGDADRVFYTTLYTQKPSSAMAQNYVIEYGILDEGENLKNLYKVYLERKRKGGFVAVASSGEKKEKKRKVR